MVLYQTLFDVEIKKYMDGHTVYTQRQSQISVVDLRKPRFRYKRIINMLGIK